MKRLKTCYTLEVQMIYTALLQREKVGLGFSIRKSKHSRIFAQKQYVGHVSSQLTQRKPWHKYMVVDFREDGRCWQTERGCNSGESRPTWSLSVQLYLKPLKVSLSLTEPSLFSPLLSFSLPPTLSLSHPSSIFLTFSLPWLQYLVGSGLISAQQRVSMCFLSLACPCVVVLARPCAAALGAVELGIMGHGTGREPNKPNKRCFDAF